MVQDLILDGKEFYGECHCKHPGKGPFCGNDGKTYNTRCDMHVASWLRRKRNSSKIEVAYSGECEEGIFFIHLKPI